MAATPAIQAVERAGVRFALHEYEHDPNAGSFGDEAVEKLGWPAARVFKTLVVSVDGDLRVFVVPSDRQLDLRSVGKRAQMADRQQLAPFAAGADLGQPVLKMGHPISVRQRLSSWVSLGPMT